MGSVKCFVCPYLKITTNMIVSIYKNVTDTTGKNVDLFKILTTRKWQHLTQKVRAEKDKKKRDKLKQQLLPAFTPSGVFKENERNDEGLIKHSGYMCIDIDEGDNPNIGDWQAVVFELAKLPEIAFAGLSASGNGVFAIMPIKYPDKHKQHFKAFEKGFAKRGLIIDPKCGNVSRLRFYSYNDKYYINKEAKPYIHLYKDQAKSKYSNTPYSPTIQSDENDVDALVREIVARGINIVPDYDSWFNVGSALSNVASGRELFHKLSQVDGSKYNYKSCNKQFDSLKPGKGISINTLFHIAKKSGITLKRSQNTPSFSYWNKPKEAVMQPTQQAQKIVEPESKDKTLNCYVDKDGKLYISNPNGDDTFSVHNSVERYKSGKGLPAIIDKEEIDTSEMEKLHINLRTLSITPL